MRFVVLGAGATGGRCARQLASVPGVDDLVIYDPDTTKAQRLVGAISGVSRVGSPDWAEQQPELVVVAFGGDHCPSARQALDANAHVISLASQTRLVEALVGLDAQARTVGRSVIVGAGFSPGLSCILARHAAAEFDTVDEIHVASSSTGGPDCAREHALVLRDPSREWDNGRWEQRRGGRELVWFPDPIGGLDCYRGSRAEPLLLQRSFPTARLITTRVAGRRLDRLTHRAPLLRPPHAEGGPGGLRVEMRGRRDGRHETIVFGVMDRPSVAAGAVCAVAATMLFGEPVVPVGAWGLSERITTGRSVTVLADLAKRGVKAARFVGAHDPLPDANVRN